MKFASTVHKWRSHFVYRHQTV